MNDSAQCNIAQLVSNEDGSIVVPTYNWTNFFASHFKKIIGIKKFYHLHFTWLEPGVCYVKERADTQQTRIQLLKSSWMPDGSDLPSIIQPKDLSPERQWYLHDQIGPFCPENDRNIACPFPTVPKPVSRQATPDPGNAITASNSPPAKRARECRTCKKTGHNSRSCPNKEI